MKIKIEIDESLQEDEVLIRCRGLTDEVTQIQKSVSDVVNAGQKYVFYKGTTEYYLQLDDVLFFQTEDDVIHVHTKDDMYETKYKLYQLEEMLPGLFYEDIQVGDSQHEPHLFHQPQPDCIKHGYICRNT